MHIRTRHITQSAQGLLRVRFLRLTGEMDGAFCAPVRCLETLPLPRLHPPRVFLTGVTEIFYLILNRRQYALLEKRPAVARLADDFGCDGYHQVFFRDTTNHIAAGAHCRV
jgi:hypothetical protein